ncbi:NUDIX domain-containing protein [Candidatus Nomurabacteria bacterium]|nr:NUDIX domain-containing protein [Candidatus Nomurabacteria bacterium]
MTKNIVRKKSIINLFKNRFFKYLIYPFVRLYWKIFNPKTEGSRAIILFENKILLVKNINLPYWTIPGGGINKNETPEQCLYRELKEELGIKVNSVEYQLGQYKSSIEGKRDKIFIFVVRLTSPDFVKQWELDDAKWFLLSQLPENISQAVLRRLTEYKNDLRDLQTTW